MSKKHGGLRNPSGGRPPGKKSQKLLPIAADADEIEIIKRLTPRDRAQVLLAATAHIIKIDDDTTAIIIGGETVVVGQKGLRRVKRSTIDTSGDLATEPPTDTNLDVA